VAEVATEVHGEVGKVFEYDDIVPGGELAYALELFIGEAHP